MQMSAPPAPQPAHLNSDSNGLAIAAFVISLVGLVATGGLISPIGLILGLVALGRPQGRGFAIAAIILGLLGSCGLLIGVIFILIVGVGLLVAGFAFLAGAAGSAENVEMAMDMATVAGEIAQYREENGAFPASLDLVNVDPERLTDPWGTALVYESTGEDLGFDLVSAGPDGIADTEDDIRLTTLGTLFGIDGARIEIDGGAGSGGITRVTAGKTVITVDPGVDGSPERFRVQFGDRTIFEAVGGETGSPTWNPDSPAPAATPATPAAPGTSEDVPIGGDTADPPAPDAPDAPERSDGSDG